MSPAEYISALRLVLSRGNAQLQALGLETSDHTNKNLEEWLMHVHYRELTLTECMHLASWRRTNIRAFYKSVSTNCRKYT